MLVADLALFVDQQQRGNTPELEKVPFLAVKVSDGVFGVGQANVGQIFRLPITTVSIGSVGADGEDFRVTRGKGRIIFAQAREMGAAMRSHKAAQEDQNDVFLAFELAQADDVPV